MPKIISAQEAKDLFLSDDFPKKGYFVIEMEKRPHARVIELKEHIKKIKRERQRSVNAKTAGLKAVFSQKIKRKLKEVILK